MQATIVVLTVLFDLVRALCRNSGDGALENAALRQQLANFTRRRARPKLTPADRAFWVALRRGWTRWADVPIVVRPATVIAWHRRAFRAHWTAISSHRPPGRPRIDREIRTLIHRMASENRWGAPRIHAELQLLGFEISERTVSNYLRGCSRRPSAAQEWRTFLQNQRLGIAAMDFFAVPTATFRMLYVWFIIHHDRRRIVHFRVTANPTAPWVIQQLREAFPYDTAPKYVIHDRDAIFSPQVTATLCSFGTKPKRIAHKSPWQNGVAERWVRSCREETLDHVIVFGEEHLRRLVGSYVSYHRVDRPHLSLAKRPPDGRAIEEKPDASAKLVALPRVGGLHHRYTWRDAA